MQREQQPPKVGDKVFLPELQIWGEIVEFYDDNRQLVTRVRAIVNGKPTLLDVTNLIVDLAQAAQVALPLLQKIGRAIKSLCQKIGLCKKPVVPQVAIPEALIALVDELKQKKNTLLTHSEYTANKAALDALLAYFPKDKGVKE